MTKEAQELLNTKDHQAIWTSEQVAIKLNVHIDSIPILVKARILRPLGGSELRANCVKLFAAREIIELSEDRKRLDQAVAAIIRATRAKNKLRRENGNPPQQGEQQ